MSTSQQATKTSDSVSLDIGIPGMKQVLNPHISTWKRLMWLSLLLTCTGAVIFQLTNRISYYLSEPTNIHVVIKENDSLIFPSINICLSMPSTLHLVLFIGSYLYDNERNGKNAKHWCPNVTSFQETLYKDKDGLRIDMKQFWKLLAMDKSRITAYIKQSYFNTDMARPTELPIKIEETEVPWTKCLTVNIVKPIPVYGDTVVSFRIPVFRTFPILSKFLHCVHEPEEFEFIIATNEFAVPLPYGYDVYDFIRVSKGQRATYRLTSRQLFYVHTSRQPCEESWLTPYLAYRTCMKNQLNLMNLSCNIPFEKLSDKNPCETLSSNIKRIEDVLRFLLETNIYKEECNQMQTRLCRETKFITEHKTTVDHEDIHMIEIKYVIQDKFFESIHEEFTYLLPALISDIGGSLGIFLGICVLSVIEMLEAVFANFAFKLKNCCNKK